MVGRPALRVIVRLASTTKIVDLVTPDGAVVQARVWEGATASGIAVTALITRISAERTDDTSQFEAELAEQVAPSVHVDCWPARLVL